MIIFDGKYFKEMAYSQKQIEKFLELAHKNLRIAAGSDIAEVKFKFSYDALIIMGISLIASYGHKVASRAGHHVKVLEKAAEILNDPEISSLGNEMRIKRNKELYDGGAGLIMTDKQADEYLNFVKKIFEIADNFFKEKLGRIL